MKVGDEVAVYSPQGVFWKINIIERETKRYWIVGGNQYRKEDLTEPGADCFLHRRIEPVTQEHLDHIKKLKLSIQLGAIRWDKLDIETLEKVFAIVCGMVETKDTGK